MILYSWKILLQHWIIPKTLTSSPRCYDSKSQLEFETNRKNSDWVSGFLDSLPASSLLNCSNITLYSSWKVRSRVLEYVAISPTLFYPRLFTTGRSLDGRAKDRAYRWNTQTPYAWLTIRYILQKEKDTIMIDLDSQSRNRAFFALLAASYNHRSIAWTQSGEFVCPSLFINPEFHKLVLVVNASTRVIKLDKFVENVLTFEPLLPKLIHLHDCSQIELLLKHDFQRIIAIHCIVISAENINMEKFLQLSKKLKAWIHIKDQWEHFHQLSLTFGKPTRFIFTDLDLSKVNAINRTLSDRKWYWT
jgi:hypothetical protein